MHIPHPTVRTMWGPARLPVPPMVTIDLTRSELLALALLIERQADGARAEGRHAAAESLDWRAADLREAAR